MFFYFSSSYFRLNLFIIRYYKNLPALKKNFNPDNSLGHGRFTGGSSGGLCTGGNSSGILSGLSCGASGC
jgi:hypothetical protein